MDSPRSRLALGIAAVALAAGLCVVAVWSVRGRLPAPVSVAPAADGALRAENLRLRAEVARLTAERDAALATPRLAGPHATPFTAPVQEAPPVTPPRRAAKPAAPASGEFTEPQTFGSASTSN